MTKPLPRPDIERSNIGFSQMVSSSDKRQNWSEQRDDKNITDTKINKLSFRIYISARYWFSRIVHDRKKRECFFKKNRPIITILMLLFSPREFLILILSENEKKTIARNVYFFVVFIQ